MSTDNPQIFNPGSSLLTEVQPGDSRVAPLLTVEDFKDGYLFGLPLKSALTGQEITDAILKKFILKGVAEAETTLRIAITPVRMVDKLDWERADDSGMAFGHKQLTRWPVQQIEELAIIWPGRDNVSAMLFPTNWVRSTLADKGLVRIVPISGTLQNANSAFIGSTGYAAMYFPGVRTWPAAFRITYIAGFLADQVPHVMNDYIGILAAKKFLSMMGPLIFPANSMAVATQGMSQSTATAGPQFLAQRMQELEAESLKLEVELKTYYGMDVMFSIW